MRKNELEEREGKHVTVRKKNGWKARKTLGSSVRKKLFYQQVWLILFLKCVYPFFYLVSTIIAF
jgi:hypothetical protein